MEKIFNDKGVVLDIGGGLRIDETKNKANEAHEKLKEVLKQKKVW